MSRAISFAENQLWFTTSRSNAHALTIGPELSEYPLVMQWPAPIRRPPNVPNYGFCLRTANFRSWLGAIYFITVIERLLCDQIADVRANGRE
jgi:hypothetical protein